jgi:hypothetical protein
MSHNNEVVTNFPNKEKSKTRWIHFWILPDLEGRNNTNAP